MNRRLPQTGFGIIEVILAVFVVAAIALAGWFVLVRSPNKPIDSSLQLSNQGKYSLFSGIVKDMNRGCDVDGLCSVTVGDRVIVTGSGLSARQEDNVFGGVDSGLKVGEKVTVKALRANENYTLQRCPECYIKRVSP